MLAGAAGPADSAVSVALTAAQVVHRALGAGAAGAGIPGFKAVEPAAAVGAARNSA
jgi:hypothetical protein